jgi:hypothetical protein
MTGSPFPEAPTYRSREFDMFGSVRRRAVACIAATAIWLGWVLVYLAFWAGRFTLFQSIVVVVVSLLGLGAFYLGTWISFGLKFVGSWDD